MKQLRPDLPDVRFDSSGRVDAVRVATWPDGVELWRTNIAMSGQDATVRFLIEGAGRFKDWSMTMALDAVGFGSSFTLLPTVDPMIVTRASTAEDLAPFVDHCRWVLAALGAADPTWTPVFPAGNESDPFVAKLTMSPAEAFSKAKQFDDQIWKIKKMNTSWKYPDLFVEVAAQMGAPDIVEDLTFFLDDLVQIGWVKLASQGFRMEGRLRCKFLRPISRTPSSKGISSATSTPAGWSTISSLDLLEPSDVVGVVRWVFDPSMHPAVQILPPADFDQWFVDHTKVGSFTIGDEEAEVFRMLGEDLPYLWPAARVQEWAVDRWVR